MKYGEKDIFRVSHLISMETFLSLRLEQKRLKSSWYNLMSTVNLIYFLHLLQLVIYTITLLLPHILFDEGHMFEFKFYKDMHMQPCVTLP